MKVTLQKASVTNALNAKAVAYLATLPAPGARSGGIGSDLRKVGDALRVACIVAIMTGKSVEVTDIVAPLVGESNEYHIAWSRTRTFEKVVRKTFTVSMLVDVERETSKTITGDTRTSKGHGRVFITAN